MFNDPSEEWQPCAGGVDDDDERFCFWSGFFPPSSVRRWTDLSGWIKLSSGFLNEFLSGAY